MGCPLFSPRGNPSRLRANVNWQRGSLSFLESNPSRVKRAGTYTGQKALCAGVTDSVSRATMLAKSPHGSQDMGLSPFRSSS